MTQLSPRPWALQQYNLPGGQNVLLSEIGSLKPPSGAYTPYTQNVTVNAVPYNDYDMPVTYAYNFTVSQQLGWHSLLEVAYVGNLSDELFMGGESISGSGFASFTDQNKTPLGAFFKPDPVTGITATDPENINFSSGKANVNAGLSPIRRLLRYRSDPGELARRLLELQRVAGRAG